MATSRQARSGAGRTGTDEVRAFFDALAEGEDARDLPFGQMLHDAYQEKTQESSIQTDDLSSNELFYGLARLLLEGELADSLFQFQRKGMNHKEFAALSARFWGALLLHMEIFLRFSPLSGSPLLRETGGTYFVTLESNHAFQFQAPFSASRMQSLFLTLGDSFLEDYLKRYVGNPQVAADYQKLGGARADLLGWLQGKRRQTLNQAQARLCSRLWDNLAQPSRDQRDREKVSHNRKLSALAQVETTPNRTEPQTEQFHSFRSSQPLMVYAQYLEAYLSRLEEPPLISPDLLEIDDQGNRFPISIERVTNLQRAGLLVGLPGSGKTRLHAWIARKRTEEKQGIDIFIDLREVARSGLSHPIDFVARFLIRSVDNKSSFYYFGIAAAPKR